MKTTTQLIVLVAALALVACGDDAASSSKTSNNGNNGIGNNGPGNNGPGNNGPIINNGVPNNDGPDPVPLFVSTTIEPMRALYAPDQTVTVTAEVIDQFGMPLDVGNEVVWSVEPSDAATTNEGGQFTLVAEGETTIRACVAHPDAEVGDICGQVTVWVDAGPPSLEVTSPAPGAELSGSPDEEIVVSGVATDTGRDVSVFVNGQPAEVGDDGSFSTTVRPRFGVNHIEVVASDGLQASNTVYAVDVLWAGAYHDTGAGTTVYFADGAVVRLGQTFFDDGSPRVTPEPEADIVATDLADMFALVLERLDVATQLDNPVVSGGGFTLSIPSIAVGSPSVEIDVTEDGIELYARLAGLTAETEGSITIENTSLDLDGQVTATGSAVARIRVLKESVEGPWEIDVQDVDVALEGAESSFADAQADAVFAVAEGLLRNTLEDTLVTAIEDSFLDQVPALLRDAFMSLEGALDGQSIPISLGTGDSITLSIGASMSSLAPVPRDELLGVLQTEVSTDRPAIHTSSRGIAISNAELQPLALLDSSPLQIGVRLALLNGILHAIWNSGAFEVDVTSLLPEGIGGLAEEVSLSGRLPPVIAPSPPGSEFPYQIEIGQLELVAVLLGSTDRYGVNLAIGVRVDLVDDVLTVTFAELPELSIWQIETDGDAFFFDGETLEGLVVSQLWPSIRTVFDGLSFALPNLDLSALTTFAPSLSGMTIGFVETRPLDLRDGWLVFDGAVVATTPSF